MKKTIYYFAATILAMTFAGCHSTADYDAYVGMLEAQPSVIDTISSPQSYTNYLYSLMDNANEFESKAVKLTDTQKTTIDSLSNAIQQALLVKYDELAHAQAVVPEVDIQSQDSSSVINQDNNILK